MIYNKVIFTDLKEKTQLDAPGNFVATGGSGKISLVWTDPEDVQDEDGDPLATWSKTRIVRKEGSPPRNANDGVPILESTEKNQYSSTPYEDTSVSDEVTYYYGAFARSAEGTWSDGAFSSSETLLGTPLSELAEGTIIKINENGSPVEFYLAKHNYEPDLNGQGRELVVRKELGGYMVWNSAPVNTWATCSLLSWLNSAYKQTLSNHIQNLMGTTAYRYTIGNEDDTVATRSDAVFILSLTEFGISEPGANVEGSALPIASLLLPAPNGQYTRSPDTNSTSKIWTISYKHKPYDRSCNVTEHVSHFAFTLPASAAVDENMNVL